MATQQPHGDGLGTEEAPTVAQKLHGGEIASDHETGGHNEKVDAHHTDEKDQQQQQQQQQQQKSEQTGKRDEEKDDKKDDEKDKKEEKKPPGGYDSVPVPKRPRGWTIRVTVHKAVNLPMADINTLSSDPYVLTQIYTDTPNRHKEDPALKMRTPTVRRETEPQWDWPWTIANVPSSGFKLKLRLYDEDPGNHDDRLGNVHINVNSLGEGFQPIKEQGFKIEKRSGSKRAYLVRSLTSCFGTTKSMHGELFVSIELLGRTPEDGQDGRLYTVGPCWWTTHFSPMLGRLAHTHDEGDDDDDNNNNNQNKKQQKQTNVKGQPNRKEDEKKPERYNFQANQIQLAGPVPKELYHRFVEFKPWVKTMFTAAGIMGWFVSNALHAQHDRVYHFDQNTKWGKLPEDAGKEMTNLFLKKVQYDKGAKIFTYVITLDALWRFTETGKEFGIDMLSKHTMHSDVGVYIAFSGEFFIRRLKKPEQPPPPEPIEEASKSHPPEHEQNKTHPPENVDGGAPKEEGPTDPRFYELVIDNDSGTYRPNADLLPLLKKFLSLHLPGLHILVLDCQKDADKMNKMKDEQRERKKAEGEGIVYLQGDDSSSISSSDEEDLAALASGSAKHSDGKLKTAAEGLKAKEQRKLEKVKHHYGGKHRSEKDEDLRVAGQESTTGSSQAQASAGATHAEV